MPRQSLSDLVDIVTLDEYGTDEQLSGFLTAFDERVRVPCAAKVLDVDTEVLGFDIEGDERRGLVARCHRVGGQPGVVSLTDVRFEPGTVAAWAHAGWSLPGP